MLSDQYIDNFTGDKEEFTFYGRSMSCNGSSASQTTSGSPSFNCVCARCRYSPLLDALRRYTDVAFKIATHVGSVDFRPCRTNKTIGPGIGKYIGMGCIAFDLCRIDGFSCVAVQYGLSGGEEVLEVGLEVGVGQGRAAYGQVAVGDGELQEVEVHGMGHAPGVAAEHLELQGARTAVPVALHVPGDAVHLVGGDGGVDLAPSAVHPGRRDDPLGGVAEVPVDRREQGHGGVGVVGIDDLEVEVDDVGARPLGNAPYGGLRNDVANGRALRPVGPLPDLDLVALADDQVPLGGEGGNATNVGGYVGDFIAVGVA